MKLSSHYIARKVCLRIFVETFILGLKDVSILHNGLLNLICKLVINNMYYINFNVDINNIKTIFQITSYFE